MRPQRNLTLLLLLLSGVLTGCHTMNLASPARLFEEEPEFVTPSKVIPVWSDTVLHQGGKKGQRGCGGRVMFYAGDGKRAVRVDGSLVVYAWNDSRDDKQRRPDRKYVFSNDDFQKHYSTSSIGDSYSFWIPWDETGGQQTELTLVARFVGRNGAEITSTPAKVILPGEVPEPVRKNESRLLQDEDLKERFWADESNGIQQVRFERSIEQQNTERERLIKRSMIAAEIPLTDGFLQRNMSNRPASYSAEALFSETANASAKADRSSSIPMRHQPALSGDVPGGSLATAQSDGERADIISPPEDRSLRFRHRVQNSRATQRSVDRALSERYQSKSRRAPWERD